MNDNDNRYYSNSIFWVEVDRITPNPYQPRKTFDELALASLAESIRQYGVLQPLVVTRKEIEIPGQGIRVDYELISGERRLRAAKLARVQQVPVVIRSHEETDKMKLELAIIENLQREDLNAVDRAKAFQQLVDQFNLTHVEVGKRVGKSREYVSNTLRILALPEEMQQSLIEGNIHEGHTRPLLMLIDRPDEQRVLFKEITDKKMTVREAELIARRIAVDRARKQELPPELLTLERELTEQLGTRVRIEPREKGGKLLIDFFTPDDLAQLVAKIAERQALSAMQGVNAVSGEEIAEGSAEAQTEETMEANPGAAPEESDEDLYSVKNFSL
jgi:ParB family chromosome partitioning protein